MDLIDYDTILPPSVRNSVRELGWIMDFARLPLAFLRSQKRDFSSHRIMLLPGYGGGDLSLKPLALFLRRAGFNVDTWGLGINNGDMSRLEPLLEEKMREEYEAHGEPLILLGWSLGGVLARELTREHPEWVEHVITMGSPIIGGPKYTIFARLYASTGRDIERIENNIKSRYRKPIQRPVTALYSKSDGIVAWEACIDKWSPSVEHHEVNCSHIAMGFSKPVFVLLYQILSEIVERQEKQAAA